MAAFWEILKYILPSLVVLGATWLILKQMLDAERLQRQADLRQQTQSVVTPIRLQAYERVVLFLERISPGNLILRVNAPGMDAVALQRALASAIREEYEHNLSQQVYLSLKAWELVRTAKEEMLRIIHSAAGEMPPDTPSSELAQKIFGNYMKTERPAIGAAIDFVKREIAQVF